LNLPETSQVTRRHRELLNAESALRLRDNGPFWELRRAESVPFSQHAILRILAPLPFCCSCQASAEHFQQGGGGDIDYKAGRAWRGYGVAHSGPL